MAIFALLKFLEEKPQILAKVLLVYKLVQIFSLLNCLVKLIQNFLIFIV